MHIYKAVKSTFDLVHTKLADSDILFPVKCRGSSSVLQESLCRLRSLQLPKPNGTWIRMSTSHSQPWYVVFNIICRFFVVILGGRVLFVYVFVLLLFTYLLDYPQWGTVDAEIKNSPGGS